MAIQVIVSQRVQHWRRVLRFYGSPQPQYGAQPWLRKPPPPEPPPWEDWQEPRTSWLTSPAPAYSSLGWLRRWRQPEDPAPEEPLPRRFVPLGAGAPPPVDQIPWARRLPPPEPPPEYEPRKLPAVYGLQQGGALPFARRLLLPEEPVQEGPPARPLLVVPPREDVPWARRRLPPDDLGEAGPVLPRLPFAAPPNVPGPWFPNRRQPPWPEELDPGARRGSSGELFSVQAVGVFDPNVPLCDTWTPDGRPATWTPEARVSTWTPDGRANTWTPPCCDC